MNYIVFFILWSINSSFFTCATLATLETVDDDELLNFIRSEKYVVVLFTRKDCEECEKYETELIHLREDLVDTLNAWVVKAYNSPLVRLYNPTKEPALVFFRHGVPLLYDGPLDDELILHTFTTNKEPNVKELSDDNFEHLTQASSGATTGDWFILFYSTECVDCQRLQARWEAVGAKLKSRMNIAQINRQTAGPITGRRFNIREVPAFIFFRQGKMYRYNIPKYDVASFVAFASDWYKNARMEIVPVPKSPFDDFTQMIADALQDNPLIWKLGVLLFGIAIIYMIVKQFLPKKGITAKKARKSK